MLNPKDEAEMAQGRAFLVENLPPLWWGLYFKCTEEGFTPNQAMDLVKEYISTAYSPDYE